MVGLLIATTLRLRTFIAIDIEKHLSAPPGKFVLSFCPEDMKDRRPHEFQLPANLVEPMRRYLTEFRELLLRGNPSTRLWIVKSGNPFTYEGFQHHLARLTPKEFGIALYPHAFRSIAATSIATEDRKHVNIIADVLRHATLRMSEKHYSRANGVRAISDLQEVVQKLRREGEVRQREARRARSHRDASRRLEDAEGC
jgi:integrase/recombinase XerD